MSSRHQREGNAQAYRFLRLCAIFAAIGVALAYGVGMSYIKIHEWWSQRQPMERVLIWVAGIAVILLSVGIKALRKRKKQKAVEKFARENPALYKMMVQQAMEEQRRKSRRELAGAVRQGRAWECRQCGAYAENKYAKCPCCGCYR